MTTLREEIRRLAEEASRKVHLHVTGDPRVIESAILAGVKLVLERQDETAWLIESDETASRYWNGISHGWGYDVNNAVRFSRKEDAERVLYQQGLTKHTYFRAKVTEHEWPRAMTRELLKELDG